MKSKVSALLVFWGLTLVGTAAAESWKVTPGSSVGPIKLGDDYKTANQFLTPDEAIPGMGTRAYLRYKEGVDVETENQKIIQIVVRHNNFSNTKAGSVAVAVDGNLKIGSSVQQMEQALGRGYVAQDLKVAKGYPRETYYAYQARGIGVHTKAGLVTEIAVWPRK